MPSEPRDIQAGAPIGDGIRDADERVATGDREAEEVHFERDPDQLVRAVHARKAPAPLPPDEQTTDDWRNQPNPPVQDAVRYDDGPSVWDARPVLPAADEGSAGEGTPDEGEPPGRA